MLSASRAAPLLSLSTHCWRGCAALSTSTLSFFDALPEVRNGMSEYNAGRIGPAALAASLRRGYDIASTVIGKDSEATIELGKRIILAERLAKEEVKSIDVAREMSGNLAVARREALDMLKMRGGAKFDSNDEDTYRSMLAKLVEGNDTIVSALSLFQVTDVEYAQAKMEWEVQKDRGERGEAVTSHGDMSDATVEKLEVGGEVVTADEKYAMAKRSMVGNMRVVAAEKLLRKGEVEKAGNMCDMAMKELEAAHGNFSFLLSPFLRVYGTVMIATDRPVEGEGYLRAAIERTFAQLDKEEMEKTEGEVQRVFGLLPPSPPSSSSLHVRHRACPVTDVEEAVFIYPSQRQIAKEMWLGAKALADLVGRWEGREKEADRMKAAVYNYEQQQAFPSLDLRMPIPSSLLTCT